MSKLLTISFSFSSVPASLGSNNLNPNLILKDGPNISKDVGERDFNFKPRGNQVSNHIDFSLPILETACQPNFLSSFCWWTVIETRIDIRQFPSQVFSIYFLIISMINDVCDGSNCPVWSVFILYFTYSAFILEHQHCFCVATRRFVPASDDSVKFEVP